MAFCTQCGESVDDDAAFCTSCGAANEPAQPVQESSESPVSEPADESPPTEPAIAPPSSTPSCHSCGSELETDSAFCIQCGAAAAPTPPAGKDVDKEDAEPAAPPAPTADPPVDDSTPRCASCGESIDSDAAFCVWCGTTVATTPPTTDSDDAEPATEPAVPPQVEAPPVPVDTDQTTVKERIAPTTAETAAAAGTTGFTTCRNCGILLSPTEAAGGVCTSCGTAIGAATAATVVSKAPPAPQRFAESPTKMVPTAEIPTTCSNCGAHLEANASFCIACGSASGAVAPPVASPSAQQSGTKDRRRLILIAGGIGLFIGALAIAAIIGIQQLGSDDDPTTAASQTSTSSDQQGSSESGAVTTTAVGASSAVDETVCWELGAQGVDATRALAETFESVSTRELVGMARTSRTALPGAARFDTEWSSITTETSANGCDPAGVQAAYTTEMASQTPPVGTNAALVWSTGRNLTETGADPLTQVAASFRLYPVHNPIDPATESQASDLPQWVVMLSSMSTAENTRSAADARANSFTSKGIPANVILSDNFGSLTPGYWAVYAGPFDGRDAANEYCRSIQSTVSDCYQRYVQVFPSTDAPYGQCGPYGMIDITGGNSVSVLSRPEDGRAEVTRLPGSATGILVAGPPENSSGSWTPVLVTGTIGWVKTQYTTDNSGCPRTTPPTSGVTCTQVATATVDLFREISNAAATASDSGALTSVVPGQHDQAAANLVGQAAASRCSASELNAMLLSNRSTIVPANSFASLTVDTLYATPFYRDG